MLLPLVLALAVPTTDDIPYFDNEIRIEFTGEQNQITNYLIAILYDNTGQRV